MNISLKETKEVLQIIDEVFEKLYILAFNTLKCKKIDKILEKDLGLFIYTYHEFQLLKNSPEVVTELINDLEIYPLVIREGERAIYHIKGIDFFRLTDIEHENKYLTYNMNLIDFISSDNASSTYDTDKGEYTLGLSLVTLILKDFMGMK